MHSLSFIKEFIYLHCMEFLLLNALYVTYV